jgi:hypothetical protein
LCLHDQDRDAREKKQIQRSAEDLSKHSGPQISVRWTCGCARCVRIVGKSANFLCSKQRTDRKMLALGCEIPVYCMPQHRLRLRLQSTLILDQLKESDTCARQYCSYSYL